jgi:hypothetical protein
VQFIEKPPAVTRPLSFIVGVGALAVGGGVLFVIGSLILFDPAGPLFRVSLAVVLAIEQAPLAVMTAVALVMTVANGLIVEERPDLMGIGFRFDELVAAARPKATVDAAFESFYWAIFSSRRRVRDFFKSRLRRGDYVPHRY